jgi:hypothetical protein
MPCFHQTFRQFYVFSCIRTFDLFFSSCINLQRPWEFLFDANVEKPLVTTNLSGKREWKIHNLTMYYAFSTILAARVQFLTNHVAQFSDILHNLGGTNFTKR